MKRSWPILTIALLLIGVGIFVADKYLPINNSPTPAITGTPQESSFPTNENTTVIQGVVSGKLCYPSSFLPPGEIVAKDLSNGKIYQQDYPGTFDGGKLTYSFNLPAGLYHLRYQAHASTKEPEIFTSGYYTECAKTTHTNECTPDSGHVQIVVDVKVGQEVDGIDLCDFYYNPSQEQFLNQNF